MIADGGCLAPYRAPRLVERGGFLLDDAETIHQVALVQTHRGMFVLGQLQSEMGGLDDGTTLIRHLVNGATQLIHRKLQLYLSVGGLYACSVNA